MARISLRSFCETVTIANTTVLMFMSAGRWPLSNAVPQLAAGWAYGGSMPPVEMAVAWGIYAALSASVVLCFYVLVVSRGSASLSATGHGRFWLAVGNFVLWGVMSFVTHLRS